MKKKILALIIATAMVLSLAACGEAEQVATEPAQEEEAVEKDISADTSAEDAVSEKPEEIIKENATAEASTDEDEIIEFLRSLYGQYDAFLEEGYDAETDKFISPITGRPYYSPYFTLADANGDNYDDLIVTGDLGLRDAKISEVMFYDDNEMAFFINMISGCVDSLSEGCIIVTNEDRDASSPIYYDDSVVYKLTPSADDLGDPERILAHFNKINEEGDTPEETDTYYAGETEISAEEYADQYAKYEAAIIPLDTYVEMSADTIASEVPKF